MYLYEVLVDGNLLFVDILPSRIVHAVVIVTEEYLLLTLTCIFFYHVCVPLAYRLPEKLRKLYPEKLHFSKGEHGEQRQKQEHLQEQQQPSVVPDNHDKSWVISYAMREYLLGGGNDGS